jgi:hypothetical protein
MANRREPELHTADDVPLTEIAEETQLVVDYFNEEATRPFMDIFVQELTQQSFLQEINEAKPDQFDKISELEFPGFQNQPERDRYNELNIRSEEYGKALGLTQKYIEGATSTQVQNRIEEIVDGAAETQEQAVFDLIMDSTYDGSGGLWFEVPDNGRYEFDDTHSHEHAGTTELFNSVEIPDTAGDGYTAQEHIEAAAEDLRHHGWTSGQKVALVSKNWKFRLRNEIARGQGYHIPMATGLRETSIRDMDKPVNGVTIMETPYLKGDEFFVYDAGIKPIKMYEERGLQLTRPSGGPATEPGDILNGSATMSFGVANTNPLGMVEYGGVDVDYQSVTQRYD